MKKDTIFRSRILVSFITVSFIFMIFPLSSFSKSTTGVILGTIYEADMETPAEEAVVKVKNILTKKVFESKPANEKGSYNIPDVPEGRYVVGVEYKGGKYNFKFELFVKAGEKAKMNLGLKDDLDSAVLAELSRGPFAFFGTPTGIAAIAASLLAVAGAGLITTGTTVSAVKK